MNANGNDKYLSGEDAAKDAQHSDFICGKYANLMCDAAFQWVFGREEDKDILIALLNELLPSLHIVNLRFYKQRQTSYAPDLKDSVFDLSCRLEDGTYIDVEVQVRQQDWFAERCLYYSTYCIQDQVQKGQHEYMLNPVYIISLMDFPFRHGPEWDGRMLSSYSLREDCTHEQMTDSLHFIFVELHGFKKQWEDIDNDKERFYFCLKRMHELKTLPEGFAAWKWARLAHVSELANMPSEIQIQYIKAMTTEIDKRAQIKFALKQGLEKGRAEGREEGRAEGREEGRAEGREEGRAEGREEGREEGKLQTAHNLKSEGVPVGIIAKCTGLTLEQIDAL